MNPDIRIRPARSTDAGKLGVMITEAVAAKAWKPELHTGAEDIAHAGRLIDRGWVSVAVLADVVAGFVALDESYVHSLFVSNSAQSQGVGKALLDHAKRGKKHLELWTFQANKGGRKFYRREGFKEIQKTDGSDNDEGLPDVRYRWERKPKKKQSQGELK